MSSAARKKICALLALLACCAPLPSHAAEPAARRFDSPLSADWIEYLDRKAQTRDMRFEVPQTLLERYFADQRDLQDSGGIDYPLNFLVTNWRAQLTIDTDTTATLSTAATVFRAAPARPVYWKLFPETSVFRQVELNGQPAELLKLEGWYTVMLAAPGEYRVTAELPLKPAGENNDFTVELRHSGAVIAAVGVDSPQALELRVDGTPGMLLGDAAAGTHGQLATGALDALKIRWTPARAAVVRRGQPIVTPAIAWSFDEQALRARATLDVQIIQGPLEELELQLPAGADHVNLRGSDVRDFRMSGGALKIFFVSAIEGRTRLELECELPRPKGDRLDLPEIGVAGGRLADEGWLLLVNEAGGELLENKIEGLELSDPREMPENVRGIAAANPLYVYKRTKRNAVASFDWFSAPPFPMTDTICDLLTITSVLRSGGEEVTRLDLRLRNRSRQFLRLKLPEGARLISLRVENQPRQAALDGGDWLIPLEKSLQTIEGLITFPVELIYCRQNRSLADFREASIDWPVLDGVPAAQTKATLYLPEEINVRGARSALERVAEFERGSGESLTYGYGYSTRPQPAPEIAQESAPEKPASGPKSGKDHRWYKISLSNLGAKRESGEEQPQTVSGAATPAETSAQVQLWVSDGIDVPAPAKLASDDAALQTNLGRQYYDLGYRAYKDRRLAEAQDYLGKAITAAPEAQYAEDAKNLLSNFGFVANAANTPLPMPMSQENVTGGMTVAAEAREAISNLPQPQDKTQRARASQIRRELQSDTGKLEAVKSARLNEGREQLARGDRKAGLKALKEAQQTEEELVSRGFGGGGGGAMAGEPAIAGKLGDELQQLEQAEIANVKLKKRLEDLQSQSKSVLLADSDWDRRAQQQYFARQIEESARAENVDSGHALNLALGLNSTADLFDGGDATINAPGGARAPIVQDLPRGGPAQDGATFEDFSGRFAFNGNQPATVDSINNAGFTGIANETLRENSNLEQNVRVLERALENQKAAQSQPAATPQLQQGGSAPIFAKVPGSIRLDDSSEAAGIDAQPDSFNFGTTGGNASWLFGESTAGLTYDPTNGTTSAGDVYRAKNGSGDLNRNHDTITEYNSQPGSPSGMMSIGASGSLAAHAAQVQLKNNVEQVVSQLRGGEGKLDVSLEDAERKLNEAEQTAKLLLPQESARRGGRGARGTQGGAARGAEYGIVQQQIETGRKLLAEQREKIANAANVEFDVSKIVGADNGSQAGQLADFLYFNNYTGALVNTEGANQQPATWGAVSFDLQALSLNGTMPPDRNANDFENRDWVNVSNGNIVARNWGMNADRVRESLAALERNEGQVVALACRNLPLAYVSQQPQTRGWFGQKLNNGVPYAILDEAQYRTLLEQSRHATGQLPPEAQGFAREQLDVIVGGSNNFGALEIAVNRAGLDSNGLTCGQTDLDLPQERYLALDNGGYLTICKSGAARDWREPAPEELIPESAELHYELPLTGRPIHFEKTFLAAGEAPGVHLEYTYKEQRK